MKKLKAVMLAIVLVFSCGMLAACGNKNYKVSFYIDGVLFQSIETKGNTTLVLDEEPTKEGYVFEGWYLDESFETSFSLDQYKDTELTENVSVYSKWTAIDYKVTYYSNNGENKSEVQDFVIDDEVLAIANPSYVNADHVFAGWCVKSNGVGTIYKPGDVVDVSAGSINLYAKWIHVDNIRITFVGDDYHEQTGYYIFYGELGVEKELKVNISPSGLSASDVEFSVAEYAVTADRNKIVVENGKFKITSADFTGATIQADICGKRVLCMVMLKQN